MEQSRHKTDKALLDYSYYSGSERFYSRLHWAGSLMSAHPSFQTTCPFSNRSYPLGQTARPGRLLGFCLAL